MATDRDPQVEELREQVAALELRNQELELAVKRAETGGQPGAPSSGGSRAKARTRSALALILVLVSVLLAPISVIGAWARVQLVDTDRFVQTFAPLAEKPEVQQLVADQVLLGIEQNLDIDGLVGDLFTGIAELNLPPRAEATLPLLEGAAAQGVRSLMRTGVETLVESPQFATLWEGALRETHGQAIAVIQGDPEAILQLSDDGKLSISLRVVLEGAKEYLSDQGIGFADMIPVVDRTIPVLESDSMVLMRTLYQLSAAIGYWLPWLALGALALGIAVARNRLRTLTWAGIGLAISFLTLALGLKIGEQVFIGAVSPSVMPSNTASVIFEQLTMTTFSTLVALIVLSLSLAVGGWLAGTSRASVAIRETSGRGFAFVRDAAGQRGITTGAFGRFLDRWHSAILVAVVVIGVLVLFLNRPIQIGGVVATVISVIVALVLLELLRLPVTTRQREDHLASAGDT